jgi:hypothetical protein
LCSKAKRADMEMRYINPIEHCPHKTALPPLFLWESKN